MVAGATPDTCVPLALYAVAVTVIVYVPFAVEVGELGGVAAWKLPPPQLTTNATHRIMSIVAVHFFKMMERLGSNRIPNKGKPPSANAARTHPLGRLGTT
jgi:hypothetical protein